MLLPVVCTCVCTNVLVRACLCEREGREGGSWVCLQSLEKVTGLPWVMRL